MRDDAVGPREPDEPASPTGRLARLAALARLGQGGAGRHVATLGAGTVLVMGLQLAAQVPIGRMYGDVEMGLFRNLVAFATIIAMAVTLRLELAIPLAGEEDEADDLARLTLTLATIAAVALVPVALVLVLGPRPVPQDYRLSVLIAPFVLWASAGFNVLRAYLSRRQLFRQVSNANVTGTLGTVGVQLGLGAARQTGTGLGIGYGIGRLVSTVLMLRASRLSWRRRPRWTLVRRWSQFPAWILVPAVLNAVTVGAVAPLITVFYDDRFAGQFGFSQMILAAPVALLGQAVASVFYVRFAAMHREAQDTSAHMARLATVLLGVGLAVFVPITLLCREVFALLWPDNTWEVAGVITGILAPYLMINFVSSPLSGYATVANRVGRLFALAWIEAALRIPALALGVFVGDRLWGIQAYSLAGLLICLYWTIWVMRLSGVGLAAAWRVVAVPLTVIALAWGSAQVGRDLIGQGGYVALSVAVSVGAMALGGVAVLRALRA